ncbi:MAG: glutathione S-transferase N-terminal domain-containing protein [Steroidobacteraceae bacterium]
MIDLYYAATPNGLKIRLFLEETGIAHRLIPVSLSKGEQFTPEFLQISPNNKIPAIVDTEPFEGDGPLPLFESGAILLYLAEKTGRFIATDPKRRWGALQWLFWQVGGLGPMAGQLGHFKVYAPEPIPYALERYSREVARLYGVLDRALDARDFIAGEYSIVDMACYPWIVPHAAHGLTLEDYPQLRRWFHAIRTRPATVRAYRSVADTYAPNRPALSEEERRVLFGGTSKPV